MANGTERRDVERVFDGEQPADGHPLTDVAQFLEAVDATYGARPAPVPRSDLAAVLNRGSPAGTGVTPGHRVATRSLRSRPRRFRTVAAIAATIVVSIAATGGLAAASALPDSVQRAVADFADQFGVHLPQPDLPAPAATASGAPDAQVSTGSSSAPDSTVPTTAGSSATTVPPSIAPTQSTTPTTAASPAPTTIGLALPSTALPTVPTLPGAAVVAPLLPDCRGNWLLQAVHLCRAPGH